jgi:hypothetical protein
MLSNLQRHCLALYSLAAVCLIVAEIVLSVFLDVHTAGIATPPEAAGATRSPSTTSSPTMSSRRVTQAVALWPGVVVPMVIGLLSFTVGLLLIACRTNMHLAVASYEVPRHLGAGWDVDNGVEDWVLLGKW